MDEETTIDRAHPAWARHRPFDTAVVYAGLGDRAQAFAWLEPWRIGVGSPARSQVDADRGRPFRKVLQVLASGGTSGRDEPRTASTSRTLRRFKSRARNQHLSAALATCRV